MQEKHSLTTRLLHWLTAALIIALFFTGWYMVELDYYSTWYQILPQIHTLGGVVLLLLWCWVLLRLLRRQTNHFPQPHQAMERLLARWVKRIFYVSVVIMVITGYLIATGQGENLLLFESIKLPAISRFSASQIDTMGSIHEITSYVIMALVVLHALGALKHHFIDKDTTLTRML